MCSLHIPSDLTSPKWFVPIADKYQNKFVSIKTLTAC